MLMGYIFGIFAFGYALFQIPSGLLVDHYGAKKGLTAENDHLTVDHIFVGCRRNRCTGEYAAKENE
jgi:hypothetical protein